MTSTSCCQVWFMPWAGLRERLEVGPITFWPLSRLTAEQVPDEALRSHLDSYFRCYVDHGGKPVDTITVCAHGPLDFRPLTSAEQGELHAAVDALVFSVIAPATHTGVCMENNSMAPPSAERYQLVGQNFTPGNDHIAVQAGNTLIGGFKIGEISFPRPWSVGGPFGKVDPKLITAFARLFEPQHPIEAKNRLFRSLQWFRMAHIESDEVSELSRIIMMATGFEILLNVPQVPDKSGWIADEVERRCDRRDSLRETRKDNKGRDPVRTKIGWWAWDFYKLRNRIVHGDEIQLKDLLYPTPNMNWITQRIVADLVFWECIIHELFALGCLDEDVNQRVARMEQFLESPAGDSDRAEAEKAVLDIFMGLSQIHLALGWLPAARR